VHPWQMYQQEAASLFRTMGFSAFVEERVKGARGQHEIDVWVTGTLYGVSFRWAVECKAWQTSIPKE